MQVSQGFAAFCHDLTRIPPRHSQSRRATNCATPRYEVRRSGWAYSPKPPALPTAPHPVVLCFLVCFLLIDFLLSIRGASLRNIVAALRLKRSLRSLFLRLGAMPSSATGGGIPPRPTAPHPVVLFYFILLHLLAFCFQSARFPRNIVAALRPTEGQTPQKPFKFTRDILPFLARFVNLDEDVIGGKYPRLYFP